MRRWRASCSTSWTWKMVRWQQHSMAVRSSPGEHHLSSDRAGYCLLQALYEHFASSKTQTGYERICPACLQASHALHRMHSMLHSYNCALQCVQCICCLLRQQPVLCMIRRQGLTVFVVNADLLRRTFGRACLLLINSRKRIGVEPGEALGEAERGGAGDSEHFELCMSRLGAHAQGQWMISGLISHEASRL